MRIVLATTFISTVSLLTSPRKTAEDRSYESFRALFQNTPGISGSFFCDFEFPPLALFLALRSLECALHLASSLFRVIRCCSASTSTATAVGEPGLPNPQGRKTRVPYTKFSHNHLSPSHA